VELPPGPLAQAGEGESKGEEKNCARRAAMDERAPGGGALR